MAGGRPYMEPCAHVSRTVERDTFHCTTLHLGALPGRTMQGGRLVGGRLSRA
jgi:hypothetical protein